MAPRGGEHGGEPDTRGTKGGEHGVVRTFAAGETRCQRGSEKWAAETPSRILSKMERWAWLERAPSSSPSSEKGCEVGRWGEVRRGEEMWGDRGDRPRPRRAARWRERTREQGGGGPMQEGEMRGDAGRCREIRGAWPGEVRGDAGRCREIRGALAHLRARE